MLQVKKTRADNFNDQDKTYLMCLIADHVSILESRWTDHKSNSAKYMAWATISKKFHQKASHPRNFTQMKDLYRRLKLKSKKEVFAWLDACCKEGADEPPLDSQLVCPDDTSFFVYDMIKPYKDELTPEREEDQAVHKRLLIEARKKCALTEFQRTINHRAHEDTIPHAYAGEITKIAIKEEAEFEFIHPSVVPPIILDREIPVESRPPPVQSQSPPVRTKQHNHPLPKPTLQAPVVVPPPAPPPAPAPICQLDKHSYGWAFNSAKRRRTFPSVDERPGARFGSSQTATGAAGWKSQNVCSPFVREPPIVDMVSSSAASAPPTPREGTHREKRMSPYELAMYQLSQAEHKTKMLVLQTQKRAETAKEEAYKMILQNAQLQRDLLQLQYENVL